MSVIAYTVTIKLREPKAKERHPRWTPEREARNLEQIVRGAVRDEYGRPTVAGVRAVVNVGTDALAAG